MTADEIIARLGLQPHPEGGHFRETYRAPDSPRGTSTAIFFLLKGTERSHWHRVVDADVTAEDQETLTARYTERAVSFLERAGTAADGRPFFLYLAHSMPHVPLFRGAAFRGTAPGGIYGDVVAEIDASVGSVLAALDRAGHADDTLVIVTSDHGMPFPRLKGHTFDLAHRVPLVACWPKGIVRPGRREAALTSAIDFAPTILELHGLDGPACGMAAITGVSLTDLLRGVPDRERPFVIVGRERNDVRCRPGTESGLGYPARAIRRGDLFYVHNFAPDRWPCGNPELGLADTDDGPTKQLIDASGQDDRFWQLCFGKRPADELYDLASDVDCVRNIAADRPQTVATLREQLFTELKSQSDPRMIGKGDVFDAYPSPQPVNRR